jgi:predicted 2-oxoglutarate/Fe(II)-dependent dioxygenase YbiX
LGLPGSEACTSITNMTELTPEIFSERIFYYKNVIPSPASIVSAIDSTDPELTDADALLRWRKWTASDDESYQFGYQKQTDGRKLGTSSSIVRTTYTTLMDALTNVGRHYCSTLGLEYFEPSPLSISKYIKGSFMGAHVDEYPGQVKEPIMSGVMYLNSDYLGGELNFPEQGVKIKPEAGSIVVFPSVKPFYHESLEILEGEKYMSPVFWIRNLAG